MTFTKRLQLVLHRPPFNVLQAHWPANALRTARQNCLDWLQQQQQQQSVVRAAGPGRDVEEQGLVLYLWRPRGKRGVRAQLDLVQSIRASLRVGLTLKVRWSVGIVLYVVLGYEHRVNL